MSEKDQAKNCDHNQQLRVECALGVEAPNTYRCNCCGGLYKINSQKNWIKSYCEKTSRNARLYRITLNP